MSNELRIKKIGMHLLQVKDKSYSDAVKSFANDIDDLSEICREEYINVNMHPINKAYKTLINLSFAYKDINEYHADMRELNILLKEVCELMKPKPKHATCHCEECMPSIYDESSRMF